MRKEMIVPAIIKLVIIGMIAGLITDLAEAHKKIEHWLLIFLLVYFIEDALSAIVKSFRTDKK